MALLLRRFRVTKFRSVEDSGWIEADSVTCLIGTNEAGKTNLLLPLWKLNPAKEGAISLLSDLPRKDYNDLRSASPAPVFIEAVFEPDEATTSTLGEATGLEHNVFREIHISRRFDGSHDIALPFAPHKRTVPTRSVEQLLVSSSEEARNASVDADQDGPRATLVAALQAAAASLVGTEEIELAALEKIIKTVKSAQAEDPTLKELAAKAQTALSAIRKKLSHPLPNNDETVRGVILDAMPVFVYYSNYGNLDSEIYLPHVIENMKRTGIGAKESAKVRTLKVLFDFVGLSPEEILQLGQEFKDPQQPNRAPTPDEAAKIAEKKKERSVLLQSAGTKLTKSFRDWWKQGKYRFRFEADGNHFRIWVSDDHRPEEVELEGRSTGLQWFLSFYLVFLVERQDAHSNAVLLLDEPGLSLHPLAQRDLSSFFDGLAHDNQLLYTSHSPFLVDADRLERVRKVYVASDGSTKASRDLGFSDTGPSQRGAGYAVHAALGLTVAESLLIGCTPVLVEGLSDQHYLTAIKHVLAAAGKFVGKRELVFPPCGGVKGVRPVVAILGGRDDQLPVVLLDGDEAGKRMAATLRQDLYAGSPARVLELASLTGLESSEIEDLIPCDLLAGEVDRLLRQANTEFRDVVRPTAPVVPQIEAWAIKQGVVLERDWKVELAKRVKKTLMTGSWQPGTEVLDLWQRVFQAFEAI